MHEYLPVRGMQRILVLCLAFAFMGMTAASLRQRILQPELVVPSQIPQGSAQGNAGEDEARKSAMQGIGELMQKLKHDPNDVSAMIQLAERFVQEKNWAPAENFARRAVVAAPGNPQPLYLLGVILHNQGNHAEAATCLERVVSLHDEPSVRYSLGVLYARYLQDPARGGQHLRAALAQPGLPDGLAETIRAELDALASQAAPSKETDTAAPSAPAKKSAKPPPAR